MMKKSILFTLAAALLCSFSAFSQGFEKGVKNLNVGLSLGYGLGVSGSYDVGITDDISIGAGGSFSSRSAFGYGNFSTFTIGGRGAYHLGNILGDALNLDTSKSDPYIGVSLGYRGIGGTLFDGYNYGRSGNGLYLSGFAGYRHGFSDKLGFFAEAGFPLSSIGITLKM